MDGDFVAKRWTKIDFGVGPTMSIALHCDRVVVPTDRVGRQRQRILPPVCGVCNTCPHCHHYKLWSVDQLEIVLTCAGNIQIKQSNSSVKRLAYKNKMDVGTSQRVKHQSNSFYCES